MSGKKFEDGRKKLQIGGKIEAGGKKMAGTGNFYWWEKNFSGEREWPQS